MAIAGRESRWDNTAQNLNRGTGDHSIGYMQINQLAHKGRFGTDQQLMDPDTNARAAYSLFKQAGWQPWTTNSKVDNLDLDRARRIVAGTDTGADAPPGVAQTSGTPQSTTYQVGGGMDKQGAVLDALMNRKPGQSLARGIISNLRSGNFNTPTSTFTEPGSTSGEGLPASSTGGGDLQAMIAEANRVDAAELPYKWGGGHSADNRRGGKLMPLDCSGAVSRILGVDPRVSGQFEGWGQAGRGKHVTIYANATHVLMEIDGHFFGTSGSNPGGGAGWIPSSAISPGYLSKFTARHPVGL